MGRSQNKDLLPQGGHGLPDRRHKGEDEKASAKGSKGGWVSRLPPGGGGVSNPLLNFFWDIWCGNGLKSADNGPGNSIGMCWRVHEDPHRECFSDALSPKCGES